MEEYDLTPDELIAKDFRHLTLLRNAFRTPPPVAGVFLTTEERSIKNLRLSNPWIKLRRTCCVTSVNETHLAQVEVTLCRAAEGDLSPIHKI